VDIPNNLKYTENDEWIRVEGNIGTIGISDYAQEQLSDIVYLEIIVSEGEDVSQGDSCATVESVKAAADVYMPVGGKVVEINEELPDTPEVINSDPYEESWLVKVEIGDPVELDALLDAAAYQALIDEKDA
jgi:glycine cleavage system H protein